VKIPALFFGHHLIKIFFFVLSVLIIDQSTAAPAAVVNSEVITTPINIASERQHPQAVISLSPLKIAGYLPKHLKQNDVSAISYWERVNCLRSGIRLANNNICRSGYDTFTLEPGEVLFLEIKATQALQISDPDNMLTRQDLNISLSNGSGVFLEQEPFQNPISNSLFFQPTAIDHLYRISRPARYRTSIDLVLLTSKMKSTAPPLVTRKEIVPSGNSVDLHGTVSGRINISMLAALEDNEFEVHGPTHMVFEHHLFFREEDGARRAEYRLDAKLVDIQGNIVAPQILEYVSLPEQNQLMDIDNEAIIVGRLQRSLLTIPEGDYTLVLKPTRTLFGRLLNEQQPAYLLEKLNSPQQTVSQQLHSKNILSIEPAWYLQNMQNHNFLVDDLLPVEKVLQVARRLSVDNHSQPDGQSGAALLQQVLQHRPLWQSYFKGTPELVAPNTFFRNILPQNNISRMGQHFSWFTNLRMKTAFDRHLVTGTQHYPEMFSMLGSASFVALAPASVEDCDHGSNITQDSLDYVLPPRSSQSVLRLVTLYPTEETDLQLTMKGGKTHLLHVKTQPDFPAERYRLNLAEAGLTTLQQQFPLYDRSTLGGPFSLYKSPGPLRKVAITEIALPADVHSLKLKRLSGTSEPLWLALQYRDGKFHTLSETDFLHALKLTGGRKQLLHQFSNWFAGKNKPLDSKAGVDLESLAILDLENDYYPLITYIKSLAKTFSASVFPPPVDSGSPPERFAEDTQKKLIAAAETAQQQEHWLVALEIWADVRQRSEGAIKIRAALAHVQALEKLGEQYLAELMLKGMYLYPIGTDGPELSNRAYENLVDLYTANDQNDKLLNLYAQEFSKTFRPDLLKPLAELIFENGNRRHAMLISLLHPEPEKTAVTLLYGALKLSWWQLYSETLDKISLDEERLYFKALEMVQTGHGDEAESLLADAGHLGQDLLKARQRAKEIADLLNNDTNHQEARRQWLQWQAYYPGPFIWTKPSGIIKDYAGAAMVRSKARHLYSQYYRTDVERPLHIAVTGPAELRFTIRPIHRADNTLPMTAWIELQDGDHLQTTPINNNHPSQTVQLIGNDKFLAGQKEVLNYHVPDGEHLLQLRGIDSSLLVLVEKRQSALGSDILPPFSPESLVAMKYRGAAETEPLAHDSFLTCLQNDCLQVVEEHRVLTKSKTDVRQAIYRYPQSQFTSEVKPPLPMAKTSPEALKQKAMACIDTSGQNEESCLAVLARYGDNAPAEDKDWLATQSMRILLRNPEQAELKRLLQKPSLDGSWQKIDLINTEEGLRFVSYAGWQPVSPFLRIRKTMLPLLKNQEEILHNQNRLIFTQANRESATIKLRLRLVEVPYLQAMPLTVSIDLSGSHLRDITLDSSTRQQNLDINVSPGKHQLGLSLKSRYTNQFLAVQVLPKIGTDRESTGQQRLQEQEKKERAYFVATQKNPVKANIHGPAIIRVDELQSGHIYSSYRYLTEKWQDLLLRPEAGRDQGLFQLYQWHPRLHEENTVSLLRPPLEISETPAPMSRVDKTYTIHISPLEDGVAPLSGAGSWEFAAQLVRRRDFEEDTGNRELEEFYEFSGIHRLYAEEIRSFFETKALYRFRKTGGPVASLQEEFTWYPRAFPITIRFGADLFVQSPLDNKTSFTVQGDEYSFLMSAFFSKQYDLSTKSYHIPSLTFFKRFLSMDNSEQYPDDHVDRDIFTTYKADHQDGIRLGDTVYHKPWLDTIWFAGASLGSNEWSENIAPDNIRTRLGWKQLMGDLQIDLTYKGVVYFDDRDRNGTSNSNAVQLDFSWDMWLADWRRLQLAGMLRHDFDYNAPEWFLTLSYHFNAPHGYRHFRPGSVDFKDIRMSRQQQVTSPNEQGAQ